MKCFVVIGGSKGIGREFIKHIIKNKKNIVLLISRNNINIESENIIHFKTDLLSEDDINTTLNQIKKSNYKIDSLVFCQKYRANSKNISLREELVINVEATKFIIESMQNSFKKNGLKSILLIGSIASKFVAIEQPIDYHISKSALLGLVNFYAVFLGEKSIRVNMVSPSTVIKDENSFFYKDNKDLSDMYKETSPLKSIVKSKDVANLIEYLLSKKSKFITGQNIIIDGGISLQWQEGIARKFGNFSNCAITQQITRKD